MKIKKYLLKVVPYFISILVGFVFYFTGLNLSENIRGLFTNLSAAFLAIPLIYLFYQVAQNLSKKRLNKEIFDYALRKATSEFKSLIDIDQPRRPLVGINGEIFLRSNSFSNNDLVKECEEAGLEVIVSPIGEWIKYTSYRNTEDALKNRNIKKTVSSYIKKLVQERDEHSVASHCRDMIDGREPSTTDLLAKSSRFISPKCGSEAVLSIGSGIEWIESPEFAGVISVMPHGCMPGGIVAAMSEKFSTIYQKPWISLTYDGFLETNNSTRINNFAELIKFCRQ